MTPTDSFAKLIMRVSPADTIDTAAGSLVTVDARQRRVAGRLSAALNPLLEVEHYFVPNPLDGRNCAAGTLTAFGVKDNLTGRTLNLSVKYAARCEPGAEPKLAVALSGGAAPAARFRLLVETWLSEFISRGPEQFVREFVARKAEAEAHISRRARDEAGLSLTVELLIADAGTLPPVVRVRLEDFPVRMSDCDVEERLTLTAELPLDDQNLVNAYLARLDEAQLAEWMGDQVRKFFAACFTLADYYEALGNRQLPEMLKTHLNDTLRSAGRRVESLSVTGGTQGQKIFNRHIDVPFRIPGTAGEIVINSDLLMVCRDPAAYRNSGSPELEGWLAENLGEIITVKLFRPYLELLLNFEALKAEVKEELSRRAQGLGWWVEQLIATPDLPPYRWLRSFTIDPEDEFKVRQSNSSASSPVRLRLGVTARIAQLQDVESYLSGGKDVPAEMRKVVVEAARQVLQKVELARLYMRFDVSDVRDEEPVARLLEDEIREALKRKFKAEVSAVTPEILETPLDSVFEGLRGGIREFRVSLSDSAQPGSVVITGDVQVEAIDLDVGRFEKFLMMAHDLGSAHGQLGEKMGEMTAQLEKNLKSELEEVALRRLARLDIRELKELVRGLVKKYVVAKYGLLVEVDSVRRTLVEPEVKADPVLDGIIRKEKEALYKLIAASADPEQIRAAEESVARLESYRLRSARSVWDEPPESRAVGPAPSPNLLDGPALARNEEETWVETGTES
jgi:hypothetical protein